MFSRRLYYRFKPYLPWHLRMGLRQIVARRQRRQSAHLWPVNELAGQTPPGWPGWPDGKKFALVFTHDVEGAHGLAKCRQLMQLEQEFGFRSSFNFIPEGNYDVLPALRAELTQNGFEVGVHDLRHDGKLYWRRAEFPESARSINRYLKDWNASGFRSGFMLHDRECLNDLDIEYDASTFDTDPFEPQPEGVHTIFPFWVSRPNGGGYVELPYTLPQDSTLFFVLKETSPEIWKKKLDWIVQRGGMALINIHPDYLHFGNAKSRASEYPSAWYREFLEYVRDNYAAKYWQALPREMARWYRASCLTPGQKTALAAAPVRVDLPLKQTNAAVVLYSYYASDPRPRRETEALQRAGMEVNVICLRENSREPRHEILDGVHVHRVPLKRRRAGKLTYAIQYFSFLVSAFFLLSWWRLRRRIHLVHVHNMPDFLVFSALLPKLLGARVILDLHDPMPELFRSIYNLSETHFIVRWLKKTERFSIAFADLVLTPNLAFKELFISRSCPSWKIETVMNSPQTTIFDPRKHPSVNGKPVANKLFVLMYHGLIVERHGLDLAVRAVSQLRDRIPGLRLQIYGEPTDYSRKIFELARELKLENVVQAHGFKPLDEIARDISKIDLGLIPNRLSSFTQINFPTRIFEYLAMHKPVMVPGTQGIRDYFNDDEILFFEAGSIESLAAKIEWAYQHPDELARGVQKGRMIYEQHNWNAEEKRFIQFVTQLINRHDRTAT